MQIVSLNKNKKRKINAVWYLTFSSLIARQVACFFLWLFLTSKQGWNFLYVPVNWDQCGSFPGTTQSRAVMRCRALVRQEQLPRNPLNSEPQSCAGCTSAVLPLAGKYAKRPTSACRCARVRVCVRGESLRHGAADISQFNTHI